MLPQEILKNLFEKKIELRKLALKGIQRGIKGLV